MTYKIYRMLELQTAILRFHDELESIHVKRLDIAKQEIDAWKELQATLLADSPERYSKYFKATK